MDIVPLLIPWGKNGWNEVLVCQYGCKITTSCAKMPRSWTILIVIHVNIASFMGWLFGSTGLVNFAWILLVMTKHV